MGVSTIDFPLYIMLKSSTESKIYLAEDIRQWIGWNNKFLLPLLPHPFGTLANLIRSSLFPPHLSSQHIGVDVLGILTKSLSTECSTEDADGIQHEARSNFHQVGGTVRTGRSALLSCLLGGGWCFFQNLIVANPDLAIGVVETHDPINKGLALGMAARTTKDINKQFLDDPQLVEPIEALVKGEDGTRSLHAVARQSELVHGMDVADLELDRGSGGRRTGPSNSQVGVHPLTTFQEQDRRA